MNAGNSYSECYFQNKTLDIVSMSLLLRRKLSGSTSHSPSSQLELINNQNQTSPAGSREYVSSNYGGHEIVASTGESTNFAHESATWSCFNDGLLKILKSKDSMSFLLLSDNQYLQPLLMSLYLQIQIFHILQTAYEIDF